MEQSIAVIHLLGIVQQSITCTFILWWFYIVS